MVVQGLKDNEKYDELLVNDQLLIIKLLVQYL